MRFDFVCVIFIPLATLSALDEEGWDRINRYLENLISQEDEVHAEEVIHSEALAALRTAQHLHNSTLPSSPRSIRSRLRTVKDHLERMRLMAALTALPDSLTALIRKAVGDLEEQRSDLLKRLESQKKVTGCWKRLEDLKESVLTMEADVSLGMFSSPLRASRAHASLDGWISELLTVDEPRLCKSDKETVDSLIGRIVDIRKGIVWQESQPMPKIFILSKGEERRAITMFTDALDMVRDTRNGLTPSKDLINSIAAMCVAYIRLIGSLRGSDILVDSESRNLILHARQDMSDIASDIQTWRAAQLEGIVSYDEPIDWNLMFRQEMFFIERGKHLGAIANLTAVQMTAGALCVESVNAMMDRHWLGNAPSDLSSTLTRQIFIAETRLINRLAYACFLEIFHILAHEQSITVSARLVTIGMLISIRRYPVICMDMFERSRAHQD